MPPFLISLSLQPIPILVRVLCRNNTFFMIVFIPIGKLTAIFSSNTSRFSFVGKYRAIKPNSVSFIILLFMLFSFITPFIPFIFRVTAPSTIVASCHGRCGIVFTTLTVFTIILFFILLEFLNFITVNIIGFNLYKFHNIECYHKDFYLSFSDISLILVIF